MANGSAVEFDSILRIFNDEQLMHPSDGKPVMQQQQQQQQIQSKKMPLDDIAHCGEPMKLVRLIPKTEILAEVKVFQCAARCPNRPHRRGVAVGRGQ
jgi:hypothetical protein